MPWHELELVLGRKDVPRAEALLHLAGADSISLADAGNADILEPDPGTAPLWPRVVVRALFSSGSDMDAAKTGLITVYTGSHRMSTREVPDRDWLRAMAGPIETKLFGERLALVAAGRECPDLGRIAINLHMGLAFGTGEHPTTAMCLEWLDANLESGVEMIDYGCGSGVLGLAALGLGAARCWAVDIDPQALSASIANAQLNGFADRYWVGTPEALPNVRVSVLTANILSGTLQNLMPRLGALLVTGGKIVLSGMLEEQGPAVREACAPFFDSFAEIHREGWVLLAASKYR